MGQIVPEGNYPAFFYRKNLRGYLGAVYMYIANTKVAKHADNNNNNINNLLHIASLYVPIATSLSHFILRSKLRTAFCRPSVSPP